MTIFSFVCFCLLDCIAVNVINSAQLPLVINTWAFTDATDAAWEVIIKRDSSAVDAVVAGCSTCEQLQCDGTVGYGGSPDESGETALDAMIMDGTSHDVGAVAGLRRVKQAAAVALAVMQHTSHSLLVGDLATKFAIEMGFKETSLETNSSNHLWKQWEGKKCQPNFWKNVSPNPLKNCGPYRAERKTFRRKSTRTNMNIDAHNHDTIGMLVLNLDGHIAAGTSTNGANHKIPGRVGDSPIAGAGAYVDRTVGGAAATGDGDVMMRFLPSFHAVELMRAGYTPSQACAMVLVKIRAFYPSFSGALVASTTSGRYGAACHGLGTFPFSVRNPDTKCTKVYKVICTS